MGFAEQFTAAHRDELRAALAAKNAADVERALGRAGRGSIDDFLALVSPAAAPYLPMMAERSRALTLKRFGRTVQMYVPMYLSNECSNICTYCGFSLGNKIERRTLTREEIRAEAAAVKAHGYEHLLVVTGESRRAVGMEYFLSALEVLRPLFSQISFEVQPLERDEYALLAAHGVSAVLVYQETYDREAYARYHPRGKKANFEYRVDTPDRLGAAGMRKIGLGVLLGLSDWRVDSACVALHAAYLERAYWKTKFSISFPRLRPAAGAELPEGGISDRELVQLVCAYRIWNENLELSLSTRESPAFRDGVLPLGITSLSAGSSTEPGGYTRSGSALRQFEVSDERSPEEVVARVRALGYEPVWKDWDPVYG